MIGTGLVRRLLLLAVLVSAPWSAAWSHAVLREVVPADGAQLDQAPAQVHLLFSEPVVPVTVRVLDGAGADRIAPDAVQGHGESLHIELPPELPDGSYVVSYRVTSIDGHPVAGSTLFRIGPGMPAVGGDGAVETGGGGLAALLVGVRAVHYFCLLAAAGGILFVLAVSGWRHAVVGRLTPGLGVLAAVAAGTGLLAVGLNGAVLVDGSAAALVTVGVWRVGFTTSVGVSAVFAAVGMASLFAGIRMRGRWFADWLAVFGAVAGILSLAATGHAATAPPRWLSMPLVVLHATAAAYWVGSLWPLAVVLRSEPRNGAVAVVRRFSAIALGIVGLLVAVGLGLSVLQIGRLGAITGTDYGRIWLVKMALVAVLLGLAMLNRQHLTPALERGAASAPTRLRQSIAVELGVMAAIVAATAGFTLTPPPRALTGGGEHGSHATSQTNVTPTSVVVDRRTAVLELSPARPGRNRLVVRVTGDDGRPVVGLMATVEMALPAMGIEPISRPLVTVEPGVFDLAEIELAQAGLWVFRFDLLVSDFEKMVFRAEIPVGE
jgi:copper transport protein